MKRSSSLAVLAALALAMPAFAQSSNPGQLQSPGNFGPARAPARGSAREQPPSAVPGARAEPTAVAPANKVPTELPPSEALFDAINRGDLPAAKDAVNRGADINGTNVLGLTPLELAVDLGRNEISFMLLSFRGSSGFSTTTGPARPPNAAQERARGRAERLAAERAERTERLARQRSAAAAPAGPAPSQTARLFAGNGGAPIPQAGFLGFDASR